jgi:glycolate oxidase FAD binding subunit
MTLRPESRDDLAHSLRSASARGAKLAGVDLALLNRVLEYTPEDMTVTVETGLTLSELQAHLARHEQWLPIDPAHPEHLTVRDLLDQNCSGPRRYGFGTIRDHLIGVRVALADGRIVHSGGKVVKNVAGYDLMKLFVGAGGSLGIAVEATFKLLPRPEAEQFIQACCDSLDRADELLEAVLESAVTPIVLDLHRLQASAPRTAIQLILGFAGTQAEVAWQREQAGRLGIADPATLDYATRFHEREAPPLQRVSVPPSRVIATLKELGPVPFIARAGNGVIYYREAPAQPKPALPFGLLERVKATFDPARILPELPL